MAYTQFNLPTESVYFIRYSKAEVSEYLRNVTVSSQMSAPVGVTYSMPINPTSVRISADRITQKILTNAPNRFVQLDWGLDTPTVTTQGVTGRLLPRMDVVSRFLQQQLGYTQADVDKMSATEMLSNISYFDILALPNDLFTAPAGVGTEVLQNQSASLRSTSRFLALQELEQLHREFNSNNDILLLCIGGRYRFRGSLTHFEYSIQVEHTWNWPYNWTFIVLENLSSDLSVPEYNLDAVEDPNAI